MLCGQTKVRADFTNMGIIAKQSIKGSIYTYLGAVLGFVNMVLLMPKLFSTEQIGLVSLLVAISIIFAQIASLGFPNVLSRVFPHFRDDKRYHNGMLTLGFTVSGIGFAVSLLLFLLSRNYIIYSNIEKSPLLVQHLFYIPILTFFSVFFVLLDNYNKALFDAATGTFLREFAGRVFILLSVIAFSFDIIDFESFVFLYVLSFILPTFFIGLILWRRKQFKLVRLNRELFRRYKSEIIKVALFGIISGFSGTAVMNIDKYMITHYLGLSDAGIYSVCFYFGTLILMPARAMRKISSIVISEAWKRNDIQEIAVVYKKSTLTQLIIALFLFVGVWANIDNIFKIIPDYAAGRYVVFFIALAYVLEMAGGLSGMILLTSKYYNIFSYLALLNVVLIIIGNMIFIPLWQLTGGAVASGIVVFIFVLIRYLFLLKKFKLHPYSAKHIIVVGFALIAYLTAYYIPNLTNTYLNIILKGSLITILFFGLILLTKISDELNEYWQKARKVLRF